MTVTRFGLHNAVFKKVTISPLVTFRIVFGLIMFISIVRFWLNGWIEQLYIEPSFHFKYFGFYWVQDPGPLGMYLLFALVALSSLGIAFGALYRLSAITFFLSFSYIELIDASYYLNHYYFISIVGLIMIFLPAHRAFSVDVKTGLVDAVSKVPAISINIIKFQLGLVYLMAGLAKLNYDWIILAMPLKIWLPAQDSIPVIGWFFAQEWTAYLFSWAGAFYDLTIVFFLLWSTSRPVAYFFVIVFHILTWMLFQIGMFPWIMIGATLIFFSADFHSKLLGTIGFRKTQIQSDELSIPRFAQIVVAAFVLFQLSFPFRYFLYPGNVFWHEQGYRFGWRVMLMEKAGYAQFRLEDEKGRSIEVSNRDFLTPVQEKMMSTQPDFMIQYAKHLKDHFAELGHENMQVKADVFVTLNGRGSKRFINPNHDLASETDSWKPKEWIIPMRREG